MKKIIRNHVTTMLNPVDCYVFYTAKCTQPNLPAKESEKFSAKNNNAQFISSVP